MEMTLEKAKAIYPTSPTWFQKELTAEFGAKSFEKRSFKDIKTFEDACEELGIDDPESLFTENDTPDEIAYKKLKVVAKAINQGWVPDWDNKSQQKWWPWFNLSSGFGFSCSDYFCDCAGTTVGSRLCFESEAKSNYAATQFIDIYKQFLTLNN
jgi:hypothetical protein